MSNRLGKYSFGIGDRFARQGAYQLDAFSEAAKAGVDITPVWNKSNREHKSVGSTPDTVRAEADEAVKQLGWTGNYLVDADHINYGIVDGYIPHSDFFTIDVADQIGVTASPEQISAFKAKAADLIGELTMGDISLSIDEEFLAACVNKFLNAALETGRIYRHIASQKQDVAIEVSMDEVENPQTPAELLVILKMLSLEEVPVNTIAPKFTGRFNKGVDYVGDLQQFEKEFVEDLYVIRHAVAEFGLPKSLKLSVHTGSDKFSLYPIIRRAIQQHGTGLHLKTAGTTWLEELIGLTEAGGSGLEMVKSIYREALTRYDELTVPYATVLDVDPDQLPSADTTDGWNEEDFQSALRHDQSNPRYNASMRQLMHTAYKIAAERGDSFLNELSKHHEVVGKNVKQNIFERHIKPLFIQ